jgi:hypothetical protein
MGPNGTSGDKRGDQVRLPDGICLVIVMPHSIRHVLDSLWLNRLRTNGHETVVWKLIWFFSLANVASLRSDFLT